ncbi:MAG TPA: arginine--tRNA ligase [Candidatus Omnitrophota bacterium]|nr:arginine--tRNA ligase [Candidatus Omnitrophota bacterium]
MLSDFKSQLHLCLEKSLKEAFPNLADTLPALEIEAPADHQHGEFATNIALKSSKILRKSPMDIAGEFLPVFQKVIEGKNLKGKIEKVEVKKPGFINFYLAPKLVYTILEQILREEKNYGRMDFGAREKIQIEFVSANPTGPLSVAHARQAAVGDALANILNHIGFDAAREYYINDGGNQINILGTSIKCRAAEILGGTIEFPENGYQGAYIKDMAKIFLDQQGLKDLPALEKTDPAKFTRFGVDYLLDVIRKDLSDFGVHFQAWSHESEIATKKNIEKVLAELEKKNFLYEKDGAIWFRSTDFGDDKDRVVKKSDGSYTYLAPDIVYHKNKFERGFARLINIWGPDHHGYIPRLTAAVEALGQSREALKVLIVQLATIYRDGQPVSMSTRRGQFISLREVIDEVGVDAARFFFLMRHINVHLDFDLELAKKETSENPVFYIQYAHARIHSIYVKAAETKIKRKKKDFQLLKEPEEMDLIKQLGSFSDILMICYHESDPYALMNYLMELATSFHKFYDCCRVIDPQNPELSCERLALANAAQIVLANGLSLLGLSTPEKM